jgi:RES domain-containing protein
MVREQGFTGIVFPSQTHESGTNVVVFTDRLGDGNSIEVNDPDGQLPRDQASWPR